jgi:Regulator of chromosome condensation (RCC1) repeat
MKRLLPSLTIVLVVGSTVLSPANAWGAQAPRVYNWGDPWGDPSGLQYYGTTAVQGVPGTIVQISTSNSASYALTKSGDVWAWGVGRGGAFGNGTQPRSATTPVKVQFPAGVKIASLPSPMPFDTGMAIDSKGDVWGWGANVSSSLCVHGYNLLYPVKLPLEHVCPLCVGREALRLWCEHEWPVGRWNDDRLDGPCARGRFAGPVHQVNRVVMGEFGCRDGRWFLLRLGLQPCGSAR